MNERRELPFTRHAVVPHDEPAAVVDPHFEVAVAGIEPAVEDLLDREASLAEGEGARLFFAAVTRMAFDANA